MVLSKLIIIAGPPISDNPFIFKNSTHVTLMWSPSFLWPGQRIQHYNISVTNKNDGINSHHMVDSSLTDPAVSFLMSWSYFQSNTLTCRGIMFSISPVTESTSELMQTITISDWIWDLLSGR